VYLTILFFLSDSITRSANLPIYLSPNQPIDQSANRPISQSTNQRKTKNKIQEEIASVISLDNNPGKARLYRTGRKR